MDFKVFISGILLLLLLSCKDNNVMPVEKAVFSDEPTTFLFEEKNQNFQTGQDCDKEDSLIIHCTEITIKSLIPKGSEISVNKNISATLDKEIRQILASLISEDGSIPDNIEKTPIDSFVSIIFENYNSYIEEFPDFPGQWSVEISVDEVSQLPQIITLAVSSYTFMGGAHPNTYITYLNFNKKNGANIQYDDIILNRKEFTKVVESAFRAEMNLKPDENLEEAGYFFENGVFVLPENFYPSEKGIEFIFNRYEAASYAEGEISFTVPYEKLNKAIKKELLF